MLLKKIGILTYFWGTNPGTALQAYSTLLLLKKLFPNYPVEIINYQPLKKKPIYFWNYFKLELTIHRLKTLQLYSKYKSFCKNELLIDDNPLITKDYVQAVKFIQNKYDMVVVGSDTVWEIASLQRKDMAPFPNIYWLSPDIKTQKIAFSVSMGATSADQLTDTILTNMKSLIAEFDLIGVRDDLTEKTVKGILPENVKTIIRTPDPTFTYEIRHTGIDIKLSKLGLDLNKPIAGICLPNINIRKQIVEHLLLKNFQVLLMNQSPVIGQNNNKNIFVLPPITPHEWAESFKFLTLSITQLFHGTIFSLKNLIPVVSIDCESHRFSSTGESKTLSLLKEFNMHHYAHLNINDVERDFNKVQVSISAALSKFNATSVKETLYDMQNRCSQFFEKFLN